MSWDQQLRLSQKRKHSASLGRMIVQNEFWQVAVASKWTHQERIVCDGFSRDAHDCSQVGMSQLHALRHSTQYLKQHHHKAEKKRLCCQMILAKAPSGELRLPCATELLIVKHTVLSLCKVMDMVGDGN